MDSKEILLICYEYEGYHSKQTTALVKRPRYVAEYLAQRGFHVTVLFSYSEQINQVETKKEGSLKLISVNYQFKPIVSNKIIQKIRTAWLAFSMGDFSSEWSFAALKKIEQENLTFSTAICFYTPRGPLNLGYLLAKRRPIKLIFDFQDPIYEGFPHPMSRRILDKYYKKIFKKVNAVSCVSKQWSCELSRFFNEVTYIPHAIENRIEIPEMVESEKLVIFYYGSIDFNFQNVGALQDFISWVITQIPNLEIEVKFAGNEATYQELKTRLLPFYKVIYLGWLDKDQLHKEISSSDVLCLLTWEVSDRMGIPSKFYEYCRFTKPILILGEDAGGFENEFGLEFTTTYVPFKENAEITKKEELLSKLFIPTPEFLNHYSVKEIGNKFASLIEL